jgi:predicted phosphoribosyltransferase
MFFHDRTEAGRHLATKLSAYAHRPDVVVLALPRGGVPVGYEVARALLAPFDVFLVRKLGVPAHPELAMGAIASGGVRVLSADLIDELGIPPDAVEAVSARERLELERREQQYRGDRPLPLVNGRCVILVDDGLATGATMEAAVVALRHYQPARIVIAAPVGARDTCARLATVADDVICAQMPEPFHAVGLWYVRFDQTSDEDVMELLQRAQTERSAERSTDAASLDTVRTRG